MKNKPEQNSAVPVAFFDEVRRVFSWPIFQQAQRPERQKYQIALGAPILQDIRLELRTKLSLPSRIGLEPKKKVFFIEFTVSSRYGQPIERTLSLLRKNYVAIYPDAAPAKTPPTSDIPQSNTYTISGEVPQVDTEAISNILAEIAVSAYLCSARLIPNDIRYLSGNILVQNSSLPDMSPRVPPLQSGLSRDVCDTIQHNSKPWSVAPSRTYEQLKFHTETRDQIEAIRKRSALLFSIREPAYADPQKNTDFFQGYDDLLEYVLPDEACAYMLHSEEGSRFEVHPGNAGVTQICLRIGDADPQTREREIVFILSIDETIGAQFLSAFGRFGQHLGKYEIEMRAQPSVIIGQLEPATLTLETLVR